MRILEPGQLAADKIYQCRCTKCRALYEFNGSEGRLTTDQREGDALVTTCPTPGCGATNWTAINTHAGSQWDR